MRPSHQGSATGARKPPTPVPPRPPTAAAPRVPKLPGSAHARHAPWSRLVKDGKLPAEERLPENPWVMPPREDRQLRRHLMRRGLQGRFRPLGTHQGGRPRLGLVRQILVMPRLPNPGKSSATARVDHQDAQGRQVVGWQAEFTTDDLSSGGSRTNCSTRPSPPACPTDVVRCPTRPMSQVQGGRQVHGDLHRASLRKPKPMFITRWHRGRQPSPACPVTISRNIHAELTSDKAALEAEVNGSGRLRLLGHVSNIVDPSWQLEPGSADAQRLAPQGTAGQ